MCIEIVYKHDFPSHVAKCNERKQLIFFRNVQHMKSGHKFLYVVLDFLHLTFISFSYKKVVLRVNTETIDAV